MACAFADGSGSPDDGSTASGASSSPFASSEVGAVRIASTAPLTRSSSAIALAVEVATGTGTFVDITEEGKLQQEQREEAAHNRAAGEERTRRALVREDAAVRRCGRSLSHCSLIHSALYCALACTLTAATAAALLWLLAVALRWLQCRFLPLWRGALRTPRIPSPRPYNHTCNMLLISCWSCMRGLRNL